jgi:hypothetical protein
MAKAMAKAVSKASKAKASKAARAAHYQANFTFRKAKVFADAIADGRSVWAKRFHHSLATHVNDLGGETNISAGEYSICRTIATIRTELELMETKFAVANGAYPSDLELYIRCAGGLRRLLETIGLQRRSRDVTTLSDFLKQHADDDDAEDAEDDADDAGVEDAEVLP